MSNFGFRNVDQTINRHYRLQRVDVNKDALSDPTCSAILDSKTYLLYSQEEQLEMLLRLFDKANPNWINDYNRIELQKPKEMQIILSSDKSQKESILRTIIEKAKGNESILHALNIYVANKIAHTCTNAKKNLMGVYLTNIVNERNFEAVEKQLNIYFRENNSLQNKKGYQERKAKLEMLRAKDNLRDYGITEQHIEKLKGAGFGEIVKKRDQAFYIKDLEIKKFVDIQKENETIDYGMSVDDKGKEILVINLPYYGQYSVHFSDRQRDIKDELKSIGKDKYKRSEVFEIESVMIVPDVPYPLAKELSQRNARDKDKKRYALYRALKMGLPKVMVRKTLDSFSDGR